MKNHDEVSQPPGVVRVALDSGYLVIRGWPAGTRPPFGVHWDARMRAHRAPGRLYEAIVATLRESGVGLEDGVPRPAPVELKTLQLEPADAAALMAWKLFGQRGIVLGVPGPSRVGLAHAALAAVGQAALILVPHSAAVDDWHASLAPVLGDDLGELRPGRSPAPVTLATFAGAGAAVTRLASGYGLLVVDGLQHLNGTTNDEILHVSTAAWRLAFAPTWLAGRVHLQLDRLLGPVVHSRRVSGSRRTVRLELPLNDGERIDYEDEWGLFLGAYDRFCAMAPGAPFSRFVEWARRDPRGRPGLLARHRALRVLALTEAKRRVVAELLTRHATARVLVFTADCASALELSTTHLIMPVISEVPRAERRRACEAFRCGALRTLVGPRLLDDGLDGADVGIVVAGAFGASQRRERLARSVNGTIYELLCRDTVELRRDDWGRP